MSDIEITGVVTHLKRGKNTVNGNPSYDITVAPGRVWKMRPDASLGYLIGDWMLNREMVLTLDERGHVMAMRPADGVM